jgi:Fuc2NAc and GlcNAc transferase
MASAEFLLQLCASSFALTLVTTLLIRAMARRAGLIDYPSQRSSHSIPTPRGGGLAIVAIASAGFIVLRLSGALSERLLFALLAGLLVAAIGFVDDRRPTSSVVRLSIHFAAAALALALLGGAPPIQVGNSLLHLGPGGAVFGAVAMVWTVNLFNFMDGIDGIAASEAIFVLCAAGGLSLSSGQPTALTAAELLLAAASLGFLFWNWPPARIFMGDVGSGYLGYGIALFALASGHENPVAPLAWLTLGAAFFVDATVTLARRLMRGERADEAHRTHAYQWAARRWGHRRVTLAVTAINVIWLLPCAWLEIAAPHYAAWLAVAAIAPLVALALWAGAGSSERAPIGA